MGTNLFYLFWKGLLVTKNHLFKTLLQIILPWAILALANILVERDYSVSSYGPVRLSPYKNGQCNPPIAVAGKLIYEPVNDFTTDIMKKATCYLGIPKEALVPEEITSNSSFLMGVKFNTPVTGKEIPKILDYTLYPSSGIWHEISEHKKFSFKFILNYNMMELFSVLLLQRGIEASFLDAHKVPTTKLAFQETLALPNGFDMYFFILNFAMMLSLCMCVVPVLERVIEDKQTGAQEMMLMMGIKRWELWLSRIIDLLLLDLIIVSGMTFFLYVPLKKNASHLSRDPIAFLGLSWLGMAGFMTLLLFFSCFFTNPNIASNCAQVLFMTLFMVNSLFENLFTLPLALQILLCFLPQLAAIKGLSILLDFDKYDKPIRLTENLYLEEDGMVLQTIIIMLIFDIILYMTLTLYVERLKPGKFGIPQPYNFCFLKSFWIPEKIPMVQTSSPSTSQEGVEAVPRGLKPGVVIKNVSKKFKVQKNQKTVIDNLSINFYEGEISGLLGHNGAGKTTLFSMISGLTRASSGVILINGYNIAVNPKEARRSLGLCPQFDMLFNDLTCIEIISFYGLVKGLSLMQARKEALYLINVLKLSKVKTTKAGKLSGGQRRKVSLAVALIGGSKVVLLDEPTTGMDPEIRREIWELLLGLRGERTIILTTHFMEEADALCDRIAILDHGKVKCFGSPMYLKSKYGKGYVLSVVVINLDKVRSIVDYVKETSGAKFKSQNFRNLTFEIPEKEVRVFPNLFSGLEDRQKKGEIASYAVTLSALEDVFLSFSVGGNDSEPVIETQSKNTNEEDDRMFRKIRVRCLCVYQLLALLHKKCILLKNGIVMFIVSCIFCAFFVVFYAISKESPGVSGKLGINTLDLSLALYPSSLVLISGFTGQKKSNVVDLITHYKASWKEVSNIPEVIQEYHRTDFHVVARKLVMALNFSEPDMEVLYNARGSLMIPISCNFIHNYLLKSLKPSSEIQAKINLQYAKSSSPIKPKRCRLSYLLDPIGLQTIYYIFLPIKERESGSKDIQLMIAQPFLYWISHMLIDLALFFLFFLIFYLCFGLSLKDKTMLNHPAFSKKETTRAIILNRHFFASAESLTGFFLWGFGLLTIAYIVSTLNRTSMTCFTIYMSVYVFMGLFLYFLFYFKKVPLYLRYFFPHWMAKLGFDNLCEGKKTTFLLELLVYDVIIFAILLLKEYRFVSRLIGACLNAILRIGYSSKESKDDFVKAEEEAVERAISLKERSGTALIAHNLKRWFCRKCSTFKAVQGISFTVNKGECFGLLGVNGAGKTTTFKMLIGALTPSQGDIYIYSKRVGFFNRQKLLFKIGYCPQYGGLIESFTGKELLTFFGRLKGLRPDILKKEVNKWIDKTTLQEYQNQKCGNYSGGNKKKLSVAIALIGDPFIIFLDEPTSGVDPAARRTIWGVVEIAQKQGQSVVLTSHSMDECEALCTRLSIMVEGKFRCIGETTTLKTRFGQGYCIEFKLNVDLNEKNLDELKKAINSAFEPGCTLVDEHLTVLQYHIKNKNLTWSDIFSKLNNLKKNYSIIETYAASSTTLEQVFIYFAAENK